MGKHGEQLMRRRQIQLLRDEIRRTLNTEQAVETSPVLPENPAPVLEKPKRGRPPKVKHDDISGRSDAGRRSTRKV
jgi:hypothetical protein